MQLYPFCSQSEEVPKSNRLNVRPQVNVQDYSWVTRAITER